MLFQTILDFDNKLKENNKNSNERKVSVIKTISERVQFYKAATFQPTYLLKRGLLQRNILIIMLKF